MAPLMQLFYYKSDTKVLLVVKSFHSWVGLLCKLMKLVPVLLILALSGCGGWNYAPIEKAHYNKPRQGYYKVRRGDTLYSIAFAFTMQGDYLAHLNHLSKPYRLRPGQVLRVMPSYKVEEALPAPKHDHSLTNKATRKKTPSKKSKRAEQLTHWQWPSQGKIIQKFAPQQGHKGIDIANHPGTPVYAAMKGEVVYAGTGLQSVNYY